VQHILGVQGSDNGITRHSKQPTNQFFLIEHQPSKHTTSLTLLDPDVVNAGAVHGLVGVGRLKLDGRDSVSRPEDEGDLLPLDGVGDARRFVEGRRGRCECPLEVAHRHVDDVGAVVLGVGGQPKLDGVRGALLGVEVLMTSRQTFDDVKRGFGSRAEERGEASG
jgi:hypothetical protein